MWPDSNHNLPEGIQQSRRNRDGPYITFYLIRPSNCTAIRMNEIMNLNVEALIYNIRGQRVMFDHDLARLYGVETKALNQAVKRNIERFPHDFLLQLTEIEAESLRSQFVTLDTGRGKHSKYQPYAFTELGIAMLSSVLRSQQAIQVNISIMRTFFKLRDLLKEEANSDVKIDALKKETSELFQIVFERIERVERNTPLLSPSRRKIGI